MTWLDLFKLLLRLKPKPKPPSPPVDTPPVTSPDKYTRVSVFASDGSGLAPVIGGTLRFDDPTWPILQAVLEGGRLKFTLPVDAVYGWQVHLTATTGEQDGRWDTTLAPDIDVTLPPAAPVHKPRRGIVRTVGRSWQDDDGLFYPLGDTLFYALTHWKLGKQAQVRKQFAYFAKHRHDHAVILGQVDWDGQEIDPAWPDYEQILGEVFDCAYNEFGLRLHVVCIGGGSPNIQLLIDKVTRVVEAGRKHMVQTLESVNELNSSGANAIRLAQAFKALGVPVATGRGNAGISTIRTEGDAADATADVLHTERGYGDDGEPGGRHARQVRQCYDFIHFARPSIDREGPGPASSVGTLDDPYQIATKRVGSIVCGAGAFVNHTGSGVYGKTFMSSAGMRYENLEDVPQMDAIMAAARNADAHLPLGIENWQTFNTGHPLAHITGNANKLYGCKKDADFVEVLIGCDGAQTFQATRTMTVDIWNIATAELVTHRDLGPGQNVTVSGLWGYLIVGTTP